MGDKYTPSPFSEISYITYVREDYIFIIDVSHNLIVFVFDINDIVFNFKL